MALNFLNKQSKQIDNSGSVDSITDNHVKIITDEPSIDATDFKGYVIGLSELIVNSTPRFTVGVYGGWGTGKTTLMQMIKDELDQNYSSTIQTIWFDAWRYENEEYSAMVPLLRTIILGINDELEDKKNTDSPGKKQQVLSKLKTTFTKVGNAIIRNTNLNLGAKAGEILGVGATFDIGKMIEDYRSDGSFMRGQETIYFHKHVSEHINYELRKIRYNDGAELKYNFRLVIFVDDLDRCTPEKALELLESIKTFFDIEGIIYVIGMDPRTIDPIISTKYGKNGKIDGMDYLQKIVQVPFQIPLWNAADISRTIRNMISRTGMKESDIEEIVEGTNIKMIIRAAQLNPRDVKRFINSLILSKVIYGQGARDFEKLIAIQAFYFRGNKWIEFLKLLTDYSIRVEFLKNFNILIDNEPESVSTLQDFTKLFKDIIRENNDYPIILDKPSIKIFKNLIELNDIDLFSFLKASALTLIKIDSIDKYLRVVESIDIKERTDLSTNLDMNINPDKQLQLLKDGNVKEFNSFREQKPFLIHLPCEDIVSKDTQDKIKNLEFDESELRKIRNLELSNINLANAFLFWIKLPKTNLVNADLSYADLSYADLSYANLSRVSGERVNLSHTNLSHTNFSDANLTYANMSYAKIFEANFAHAEMPGANLTGASVFSPRDIVGGKFVEANLTGANLTRAELTSVKASGAYLSETTLTGATFSYADLSGAVLSSAYAQKAFFKQAKLIGVYLSNADLSHADLSGAFLIGIRHYDNLKTNGANFEDAIIDNQEFIDYLRDESNNAKNVPERAKTTEEVWTELGRIGYTKKRLDKILSKSNSDIIFLGVKPPRDT